MTHFFLSLICQNIFSYSCLAEVNKKPRMRTADDVISRILWDNSVVSSEFVVGYVDRFLGVLERPFDDFNWDTNPCDCDYTTELALPRHRIQYFTYRGLRVWDRHTRTDRVFGSTGQSLAPPFGGDGEVKGKGGSVMTKVQSFFSKQAHILEISLMKYYLLFYKKPAQKNRKNNKSPLKQQKSSHLLIVGRKGVKQTAVFILKTHIWMRRSRGR